jgi:hypothetical protein
LVFKLSDQSTRGKPRGIPVRDYGYILELFLDSYLAFFILLMVFIHMEIPEELGPTVALNSYSQAQLPPGAMNENSNKDSSIYPGVLPWPGTLGLNLDNFINSQLI